MNKVIMMLLLEFHSVVVTSEGVILVWWRRLLGWSHDGFTGVRIILVGDLG